MYAIRSYYGHNVAWLFLESLPFYPSLQWKRGFKGRWAQRETPLGRTWFSLGLVLGLVSVLFAYRQGYLPERPSHSRPADNSVRTDSPALLDDADLQGVERPDPRNAPGHHLAGPQHLPDLRNNFV